MSSETSSSSSSTSSRKRGEKSVNSSDGPPPPSSGSKSASSSEKGSADGKAAPPTAAGGDKAGGAAPAPKKSGGGNEGEKGEAVSKDRLEALQRSLEIVEGVLAEIKKQQLTGVSTTDYIMRNSIDVQRIATLQQLHHQCEGETPQSIMDFLRACSLSVSLYTTEVQSAIAKGFCDVLSMLDQPRLQTATQTVNIVFTVANADAVPDWRKLFLEIVRLLDVEFIKTDILPAAIAAALDVSRPIDVRLFQLDAVVQSIDYHSDLAERCVSMFSTLVKDNSPVIRAASTNVFFRLCKMLPLYFTREVLLLDMIALLLDEEPTVTTAMFKRLVEACEFFDQEFSRQFLVPLFRRYATNPPPTVKNTVVESLGLLMWNIRSVLPTTATSEDWTFFVDLFKASAESTQVEYRQFCAYNIPGVVAAVPDAYVESVLSLVGSLCTDTVVGVRTTIASGFHEITPRFCAGARVDVAKQTATYFTILLEDADTKVREKAVSHLGQVLQTISQVLSVADSKLVYKAVATSVAGYEGLVRTNWRKVAELFSHIPEFTRHLAPRELVEMFMPMMIWHLQMGASALNGVVSDNISHFIRLCRTDDDRREAVRLMLNLTKALSSAKGATSRAGFIDLATTLCATCSNAFAMQFLLQPLLSIADDRVISIRIKMAKHVPAFASVPCLEPLCKKILKIYATDNDAVVKSETALALKTPSKPFNRDRDAQLALEESSMLVPGFIADVVAAEAMSASQIASSTSKKDDKKGKSTALSKSLFGLSGGSASGFGETPPSPLVKAASVTHNSPVGGASSAPSSSSSSSSAKSAPPRSRSRSSVAIQ